MIVLDIGCARYGGDESIPYLIEEFHPWLLLGFDPAADPAVYNLNGTTVSVSNAAAWTNDGTARFVEGGLRGHLVFDEHAPAGEGIEVPCVDLARVIREMSWQPIALKMDAEGAEWQLLPYLNEQHVDHFLTMAWVEWHCDMCGRGGGKEINHVEGCRKDAAQLTGFVEDQEKQMRTEMHRWNR